MAHSIEAYSGLQFDYLDPHVTLDDVAHGMANECRFGRQTRHFYSVAEHSILVAAIVERMGRGELALPALWHDAHEAYMGDVPTPLKSLIGSEWHEIASRIDVRVAEYVGFNLGHLTHPVVKYADKVALYYEAHELMPMTAGWKFVKDLDHSLAKAAARGACFGLGLGLDMLPAEAASAFTRTHARLMEDR